MAISKVVLTDASDNQQELSGEDIRNLLAPKVKESFATSPDGSVWEITVDDTGTVLAVKVTP